jgi:RNA polymerase sigma factor (sigma-70 family)
MLGVSACMSSTPGFPPTRWTLIVSAGQTQNPAADEALDQLCRIYWYPIYAFIRRLGNPPDQAQDLTQDFFARFLERRHFAYADPARGRFRSFLLTSVKRFLIDQAERRNAGKRGGNDRVLTLDLDDAEQRYGRGLADDQTPERLFEREWARTLLARVNEDVRTAFSRDGHPQYFEQLRQYLPGDGVPYAEIAHQYGTSEGTLKVAYHRMRRRYREMFRNEIAHLVAGHGEVEDELRYLVGVLRG